MRTSFILRTRAGFTLIEVIIAVLLIDVAMFSLVAAAALSITQLGDAARRRRAIDAATTRVETLASAPCSSAASGTAVPEPGMVESWWTEGATKTGHAIADSISYRARDGVHQLVIRSAALC